MKKEHIPRKSFVVTQAGKKQIIYCVICQDVLTEETKRDECKKLKE